MWEKTFSEKVDYLSEHLADDLVIEFMGKDSSSQTKEEHIAWCVSDESPRIGGFKVIFEEKKWNNTAFNFTMRRCHVLW